MISRRVTDPRFGDTDEGHVRLPSGACDAHCHVLECGDRPANEVVSGETALPGNLKSLETMWETYGFDRAVIVQASLYGADHTIAADALMRGAGRYRGVALIYPSTSAHQVARLHELGFRGARLHFMPHLASPARSTEEVQAVVTRVRPFDWSISLHLAGNGIVDYEDLISSLPVSVVIDHMARVDLALGPQSHAVQTLKRLLDRENIWVKLSGSDRLAQCPPALEDAVAFARSLMVHAPDRVVWGTDFPHTNSERPPTDAALVATLREVAPSEAELRKLLVDNPATLFDFPRVHRTRS